MIPPRLSFIVSSDLRDPWGSESCLLCFCELILQKRFKTGTGFWWEMLVLFKSKYPDSLLLIYLLFFITA